MREQRTHIRRKSDQLIRETADVHRTILDLLQGKKADFAKGLRRMQVVVRNLGRRQEDHKLGEALSQSLEQVVRRLMELGIIDQFPRRVRLKKTRGAGRSKFPVGLERVGWEMELPKPGARYCLYLDDGRLFRTGEVTQCRDDRFRTGNSEYAIETLADPFLVQGAKKAEAPPGEGGTSRKESKGG